MKTTKIYRKFQERCRSMFVPLLKEIAEQVEKSAEELQDEAIIDAWFGYAYQAGNLWADVFPSEKCIEFYTPQEFEDCRRSGTKINFDCRAWNKLEEYIQQMFNEHIHLDVISISAEERKSRITLLIEAEVFKNDFPQYTFEDWLEFSSARDKLSALLQNVGEPGWRVIKDSTEDDRWVNYDLSIEIPIEEKEEENL